MVVAKNVLCASGNTGVSKFRIGIYDTKTVVPGFSCPKIPGVEQDPRKDLDPTYHTPLAAAEFSAKKLWVKKLVQAVDY